ncbi:hypothetical protein GCM10009548_02270 [Streptomyces malaysiensis subsp. malaysiensis]|uniref:DUF7336 domain-containing protein n=1 Tax=Streptomyces malaysiensis TaxID=92644 RepID=A0ABX6W485_STRMQ|nr:MULTISPECIES: hypothetical protein [Streptomyces]QPI56312.1 hypothetical protein I1A49_16420 [Streptomyces solisilvae]UHH17796.1 hypothetical protein LUV23_16535 [Streptomyces sp. HNM0561]
MSDQQTVYVVTSGSYSDYRIRGVFLDELRARKYVDELRGSSSDVRVEEHPARGPEFVAGRDLWLWTRIDARTGDIKREWSSESARDASEHDGQCSTQVYSSSLATGRVYEFTVTTRADFTHAERARKSHAERVAKKRAEVMGL